MKNVSIRFGIIAGIIIIAYSILVFLVMGDFSSMDAGDFKKVEMLGFLRYIILFLTVFLSIRYFKKQNSGEGTFRQLFLAGLYTALVIAMLVGLMELLYMWLNPQFISQYAELSTRKLQESGASAERIAEHKKQLEQFSWMASPAIMGVYYFLETAVLGAICSAIVGLLMRRRTNPVTRQG
ncbi:MAG TPA: DUF4199 domain-containing protein [Chitinophagaceae bacterium]